MDSRIIIEGMQFLEQGCKVEYRYRATGKAAKLFDDCPPFYAKYEVDVRGVPESILYIPFLANLMPIAWFANFEVQVPSIDNDFMESLDDVRMEFAKHYKKITNSNQILAGQVVYEKIKSTGTALLFSGGLDAFESLTRNIDLAPHLVSVHGADIEIKDKLRWLEFKRFNDEQPSIRSSQIFYVESNMKDFYTHHVDLLVGIGWWGKVQHGLGLLGLLAPLSITKGFSSILIASSNTGEVSFGWGSTSETDEKVSWAGLQVTHDGFHLRRTQKVENIVAFARRTGEKPVLRVCYSENRTGYNCNRCAKCQRTMLAFLLANENPNGYGFQIPHDLYSLILDNFPAHGTHMTIGVRYEWLCLQDKARSVYSIWQTANVDFDKQFIKKFCELDFNVLVIVDDENLSRAMKLKFIFIRKFPRLFRLYLSFRTLGSKS